MKISNIEYLLYEGYPMLSMEVEGVKVLLGVEQKDWLDKGYVRLGEEFEAARPDLVSIFEGGRVTGGFVKSDELVKIYRDFYKAANSLKDLDKFRVVVPVRPLE